MSQLARELCQHFPGLPSETADHHSGYLLSRGLARLLPAFSFHDETEARSVVVMRAQPDLPWNLCAEPFDALSTLQTHFPGLDLKRDCRELRLWFVGVRLAFAVLAKNRVGSKERARPTRPRFDQPGAKPPPDFSSRVLIRKRTQTCSSSTCITTPPWRAFSTSSFPRILPSFAQAIRDSVDSWKRKCATKLAGKSPRSYGSTSVQSRIPPFVLRSNSISCDSGPGTDT